MKQQRPVFSAASVACNTPTNVARRSSGRSRLWLLRDQPFFLATLTVDGHRALASKEEALSPPLLLVVVGKVSKQAASKSTTEKEGQHHHYEEHHPQKGRRGEPLVESELGHGQEGARGKEGGLLDHLQLGRPITTAVGQLV